MKFVPSRLCTKSTARKEDFLHKGAKAQSAPAFLKVFFAPLREKQFLSQRRHRVFSTFRAKPSMAALPQKSGAVLGHGQYRNAVASGESPA